MKAWRWFVLASISTCAACGADAGPNGGGNAESFVAAAELPKHDCGGPEGNVCPTGQYCATAVVNRCPGDEIKGNCRDIPQACVDIYQPSCGCDGQTYDNECQAGAVSVAAAYDGACAPFCGGFAGIPCPGAGTCIDNATDGCDPAKDDVDCASLCRCEVIGICDDGGHWDGSPEVCDCVWTDQR